MAEVIAVAPGEAGCLDAAQLAQQVMVWLEREQLSSRLSIHANAIPDRTDAVQLWIELDGERVVDRPFEPVPQDCDAVHAALGLAIAFALDSTVLDDLGVTPPVEPPPPRVGPLEPVEAPPDHRRATIRLATTTGFGLHPIFGLGGQLLTSIQPAPVLDLRLGGGATAGIAAPLGEGRVQTTVIYGRGDGCVGGQVGRSDLRGCLGVMAGAAATRGSGYEVDDESLSPWVALAGGVGLLVPADGAVAFALDLEAIVPVVKPRIVIVDSTTGEVGAALNLPPIGGMLCVGVAFVFD